MARALAWQARGNRFDSGILHKKVETRVSTFFVPLQILWSEESSEVPLKDIGICSRIVGIRYCNLLSVHLWLTAESYQLTAVLSILRKTPLLRGVGGVYY